MPTILVVDDVATDRLRISGLASAWMDSIVVQASSGPMALEMIEEHRPDIVLTDLNMPEMNGLQLVEAIRDQYPYIPVILMTAEGSEDLAALALEKGAASYVPKRHLAQMLDRTLLQVHVTARDSLIQPEVMHQIQSTKTCLSIYSDRQLIRSTVGLLVNFLRCMPLGDETERMRTGIAIEEALLNAHYHGNFEVKSAGTRTIGYDAIVAQRSTDREFGLRKIHIDADVSRQRAIFVIRDEGSGFSPEPYLNENSKPLNNRQRGIQLMTTIMDDVSYSTTGNEVTMVRHAITGLTEE